MVIIGAIGGIIALAAIAIAPSEALLGEMKPDLRSQFPSGAELLPPGPPKTPEGPEEKQIAETILEAYRLFAYADMTFDTSKFDTVLIDDPRFPLRSENTLEVIKAFGYIPPGAGMLTYMRAWYRNWERGALLLEGAERKAWTEGRKGISAEELNEIEEKLGYEPVFKRPEPVPSGWEKWFVFYKFDIRGDVAMCLYDDGGVLRQAFLVMKEGKWYIADNIPLWSHY
ncbi:MAG: hypothetical protein H5T61_13000 [Thermoflexales bacterium]|nr:hypothetical protein [Thermoflexales bacterium]